MHAAKRDAALAWASRGFNVFPLRPGTKLPYRNSDWTRTATHDAGAVAAMWTDPATGAPLDHNIGVLCDDMIVVDVDPKHVGDAEARFSLFELDLPETLVVRTPSGGWHHYLTGPNVSLSVGKLGRGIDIRSAHGYVVAPGSELDPQNPVNKGQGGGYAVVEDRPVAKAPEHLIARCDAPRAERSGDKPMVELDKPQAIAEATFYLDTQAPAAIEGNAGDNTAFKVAAKLKDIGVSSPIAVKLMWERWNDRCLPPWQWDELEKKVSNAYAYGQNQPGAKSASALFTGVPDTAALPSDFDEAPRSRFEETTFRPWRKPADIPTKPWVLEGLLCRKVISVLAAPGASGKTALTLALAAHIAQGEDYAGFKLRDRTKVLVVSCEEDRDELEIRMHGVCQTFGFDPEVLQQRVILEEMLGWKIAIGNGRIPTIMEHEIEALVRLCGRAGVGVVIVDPLRKAHYAEENDSAAMDLVMEAFSRLARRADVALLLCHHSAKVTDKRSLAGDAAASRGASAITDAARIAVTLVPAVAADVELGVPRSELGAYSRLDVAKINLGPKPEKPIWFKKTSVTVGEHKTFAVVPVTVERRVEDEVGTLCADIAEFFIRVDGPQRYSVRSVAVKLLAEAAGYENIDGKTHKDKVNGLMNKLKSAFKRHGHRVKVGDTEYTIKYIADTSSGGEAKHMLAIE